MRNILLVIKYEIVTTLQKRSFWILTFIFPVFILALSMGTQFIGQKAIEQGIAEIHLSPDEAFELAERQIKRARSEMDMRQVKGFIQLPATD